MTSKISLKEFFTQLDRSYFMESHKSKAPLDRALPIGYGQTISQPSLVLQMTELLELHDQAKVLEIGTGSGYQTCLLAEFSGDVYTVERISELSDLAKSRLDKLGYDNIHYFIDDGSEGLAAHGPYDRIMVTAAARKIPEELLSQLSPGGLMIIPVGNSYVQSLLRISKNKDSEISTRSLEQVMFVPLIGKYSI